MEKRIYATDLATVFNSDGALTPFLNEVVLAPETSKRAPAELANFILADLDGKPDYLDAFVDPGSKQKERTDGRGRKLNDNEAKARDADRNWDWYQYPDGMTGETIKGQWFIDYVSKLDAGIAINKVRDGARAAKAGDKEAPHEYLLMTTDERDKLIAQYDARLTRLANVWRTSINVIRFWQEIGQRIPDVVEVAWRMVDEDRPELGLSKSTSPIKVIRMEKNKAGELVRSGVSFPFSVSEFLNLDIDKAIEKGHVVDGKQTATYVSFIQSERTKPAPASGKGKKTDKQLVETAVTGANVLSVADNFRLYTENQESWGTFLKTFANAKPEDKDHYILTFGRIENKLAGFMAGNRKRYHEIELALKRKDEEEAAAKAKLDAENAA